MIQTVSSGPIRVRLQFQMEPRHRSLPFGIPRDYTINDRFVISEGPKAGLTFVYSSASFSKEPEEAAARTLAAWGYNQVIGKGTISGTRQEWIFTSPSSAAECELILKRVVVDDVEILRYFGSFSAMASDGVALGLLTELWCVQE